MRYVMEQDQAEIERHHKDFQKWEDMADNAARRASKETRRAETAENTLRRLQSLMEGTDYESMVTRIVDHTIDGRADL
jgi:hypothetical protein